MGRILAQYGSLRLHESPPALSHSPPRFDPLLDAQLELRIEGQATQAWQHKAWKCWHAAQHQPDPGCGTAALLLHLAGHWPQQPMDPAWHWLRQVGKLALQQLCMGQGPQALRPPPGHKLAEHLNQAPFFQGAQRLRNESLSQWWQAMAALISAQSSGDWQAWLKNHAPQWQGSGKLALHLAENPGDAQRPFAFLATFTDAPGRTGELRHLPLARALKQATERKDQALLDAIMQPLRWMAQHSKFLARWLEDRRLFQALALDARDAWNLLRELSALPPSGIVLNLPNWWREGRCSRPQLQVQLQLREEGGQLNSQSLLDFKLRPMLEDQPLSDAEWAQILSAQTGLISLRGQWVEVDSAKLEQLLEHWQRVEQAGAEGLNLLEGLRLLSGLPTAKAAASQDELAAWCRVEASASLARELAPLRRPPAAPTPEGLKAELRPYQQQGLGWLAAMSRLGLGACLADDMGLGKTLQVLALLVQRQTQAKAPSLLVVPASLLGNWQAEAARFAPALKIHLGHPAHQDPASLRQLRLKPAAELKPGEVLLTSYTMLRDSQAWQQLSWDLLILDEAQQIKNPASQTAQCVRQLKANSRLALSGTPLENHAGDLWSLLEFLNPGLAGGLREFSDNAKRASEQPQRMAAWRQLLQMLILRRLKTDPLIAPELPPKIERDILCPLSRRQAILYAKRLTQLREALQQQREETSATKRQGLILAALTHLKQICNHPSQFSGDGDWDPAQSGKFLCLERLVAPMVQAREKLLVFTQFRQLCEPLQLLLAESFGDPGLILHGGTPVGERQRIVETFQSRSGPPFLVLSAKAGGTGLNLTAATQVIHFDRWWNPATESQATDRAHRIGQKQTVLVHKLITEHSIEQRIDAMLNQKAELARGLLDAPKSVAQELGQLSDEELLAWLAGGQQAIQDTEIDDLTDDRASPTRSSPDHH